MGFKPLQGEEKGGQGEKGGLGLFPLLGGQVVRTSISEQSVKRGVATPRNGREVSRSLAGGGGGEFEGGGRMGLPPSTAFRLRPNHEPHLGTNNEGAVATRPPLSYIISVMRDCFSTKRITSQRLC